VKYQVRTLNFSRQKKPPSWGIVGAVFNSQMSLSATFLFAQTSRLTIVTIWSNDFAGSE
jgi:hypothetical protein